MNPRYFFLLILVTFAPSPSYAWWDSTHSALAEKVCSDFNCSCASEVAVGANIPDDVFKDVINHHCYNLSQSCPESPDGLWKCPTKNNCPAYMKMNLWLSAAANSSGCERWKDVAIASHYFFDTKVFWHNVQDESSEKCHSPFESKANDRFKEKTGDWEICQCGQCVSSAEFAPWVHEFENKINFEEKVLDMPLFEQCNWWCKVKNFLKKLLSL